MVIEYYGSADKHKRKYSSQHLIGCDELISQSSAGYYIKPKFVYFRPFLFTAKFDQLTNLKK